MEVAAALRWLELLVAGAALLGAVKSAYNGHMRGIIRGIQRMDEVADKVDVMCHRLDKQREALVAVAHAQEREDVEIDPKATEEELGMDAGVRRYMKDDGEDDGQFLRGGNHPSDDD